MMREGPAPNGAGPSQDAEPAPHHSLVAYP